MNSILNQSATKKFILAKIAALRPGFEKQITRVSKLAIENYEARLRAMIESDIMIHPSVGRTFK
jgi:hypothetical protein